MEILNSRLKPCAAQLISLKYSWRASSETTLNLIALAAITSTSAFAAENTLTIYTYDSFAADWGPGPKIEQALKQNVAVTLTS